MKGSSMKIGQFSQMSASQTAICGTQKQIASLSNIPFSHMAVGSKLPAPVLTKALQVCFSVGSKPLGGSFTMDPVIQTHLYHGVSYSQNPDNPKRHYLISNMNNSYHIMRLDTDLQTYYIFKPNLIFNSEHEAKQYLTHQCRHLNLNFKPVY